MSPENDDTGDQALEKGFQLNGLRIDPEVGEVSGPGRREKLDPKVMGVLVLMAQRAGHVVSREELLAKLWPNAVVSDDALTRCFYELRRQLSHAGGSDRYREMIETLPKRGYRLNGEIAPLPAQPRADQSVQPKWRLPAIAIAIVVVILLSVVAIWRFAKSPIQSQPPAVTATADSIAVLPFLDMSAGQDQGYFSDGISEEILNRLAQSEGLRVISRTSSFSFRNRPVDVPEIAAKLNVSHVLEGSVRRSGDRVRITAQLIAAASNSHVWSRTYDRAAGDLFSVQDEIATAVATALQVQLAGGAHQDRKPPTPEAYEKYLQGKFFYDRRAPGDVERSVTYFEQAVALDPGYAKAWAALSGAYSLLIHSGDMPADAGWAKQKEAAIRATTIDPGLAEGHSRLARYYFEIGEREKGLEHSRRAAELDPEDPLVLGGQAGNATWQGEAERALALYRRLADRDPLSTVTSQNLAIGLLHAGFFDEAIQEFRKSQELNPGIGPEIERQIAQLHVIQGRFDDAYSSIERLPEGRERDRALALLHRVPGHRSEADTAFARLTASAPPEHDVALAEVFAYRGMRERALASLEAAWRAIQTDMPQRRWNFYRFQIDMRTSPLLKPLADDARVQAILAEREFPSLVNQDNAGA